MITNIKLAILCTHPIQYYSPWFKHLASPELYENNICLKKIDFKIEVFYAHKQTGLGQAEAGFGVPFEWDIPLLEGYPFRFLKNRSKKPGLGWFGGCDCPEIGTILKKEEFTHLLIFGWHKKVFWQGFYFAKKYGIKVFCRGDSQVSMQGSMFLRICKSFAYPLFLKYFDAHLYVGNNNFEYLRAFGVSKNKLVFCPHFVDNFWWGEQSKKKGFEIKRGDKVNFLFAGKFISKKRVNDILEAISLVPDACINLIGSGPLWAELEARANKSDLVGRVKFLGFKNQKELPSYLSEADCLVLASEGTETWGLIVNEAMACGVPAIVSDACGCSSDLVEDGLTGFVFPVGNIKALASCMVKFIEKKDFHWRDNVLKKIQNYSISQATQGLFEAFQI